MKFANMPSEADHKNDSPPGIASVNKLSKCHLSTGDNAVNCLHNTPPLVNTGTDFISCFLC